MSVGKWVSERVGEEKSGRVEVVLCLLGAERRSKQLVAPMQGLPKKTSDNEVWLVVVYCWNSEMVLLEM